jgi:hypothetical protein
MEVAEMHTGAHQVIWSLSKAAEEGSNVYLLQHSVQPFASDRLRARRPPSPGGDPWFVHQPRDAQRASSLKNFGAKIQKSSTAQNHFLKNMSKYEHQQSTFAARSCKHATHRGSSETDSPCSRDQRTEKRLCKS